MATRRSILIVWFAIAVAVGCAPPMEPTPEPIRLDPSALSGQQALEAVRRFIDVGPRPSGSQGAEDAAKHIAAQLQQLDLTPSIDTFSENTVAGPTTFRNVTATVPGRSTNTIIVAAHYDTKFGVSDDFVGANDSGSGVGLLLELARILVAQPDRELSVMLAFLDGEEARVAYSSIDGLHGSRRLASVVLQQGLRKHLLAVIVVDMIGDRDLSIGIPRNSSSHLIAIAFDAATAVGARNRFSLGPPIIDDHVPFLEHGIPAVDLIDFQFGSSPGQNDYWHTDDDTFDKLSAESLQTVGQVVIVMLNRLTPAAPSRP